MMNEDKDAAEKLEEVRAKRMSMRLALSSLRSTAAAIPTKAKIFKKRLN